MDTDIQIVTVVTPSTGKNSLFNLIESMTKQTANVGIVHIILWDDVRHDHFAENGDMKPDMKPEDLDKKEYWNQYKYLVNNIVLKGKRIDGIATGSALRAVGLLAANTELVTFADDDIIWEPNHLETMLDAVKGKNWAFCKRKIWTKTNEKEFELLGIDEFESVGELAKTPYKMVDNSSMIFRRRFGVSAAPLYREAQQYNDDRQFYQFLMQYAGEPGKTNLATVNQVCPDRLVEFFRQNCTKV